MICETCKHQPKRCSHAVDYGEMIGCSFYTPRIATKADEIRNMTDEELAEFFCPDTPRNSPWCEPIGRTKCGKAPCRKCMLKWLQQPAETEGKK